MPRDEIASRVARYAVTIDAPVVLETAVERLRVAGDGFELETNQGPVRAREVIVATGGFHIPLIPQVARAMSARVLSLHSAAYRRETTCRPGPSSWSGRVRPGCSSSKSCARPGGSVYSVGATGRVPRRYRGRDIFFWLSQLGERGEALGTPLPNVATLPDPRRRLAGNPHLSGHDGGHDTDLRQIAESGTTLLGRLMAIDGERVHLAADLGANLAFADGFFEERFRKLIDAFIEASGIDCRRPSRPQRSPRATGHRGARSGVSGDLDRPLGDRLSAGFRLDRASDHGRDGLRPSGPWRDRDPGPLPHRITGSADQRSATLFGVGRDARILAERIAIGTADGGRATVGRA